MAYEDLLKDTSESKDDGNYFLVTITDLDLSTQYPMQFRWKNKNGTLGAWSSVKYFTTEGATVPGDPKLGETDVVGGAGFIKVTWSGNDVSNNPISNFDRVDIHISGTTFGDGTKPAGFFKTAGTQTFPCVAGIYIVQLKVYSVNGASSFFSDARTVTVTDVVTPPEPPVNPSIPTVTSVLGAIQLSWNGKTSTGGDQPYGFTAAKVYVGTTSGFTTSSSNQVDVLNFANGQNTLNIGVGTVVNGTALTYGVDYYVKIATTNGIDTSAAVSASGNPVRIGQVTSGDIITINADKIATGTLSSGSTITVGSTSGKHIKLSGTGDPFIIYGTGGVSNPILSYNGNKLTVVGDGTFSGALSAATGTFAGSLSAATGSFSGTITASAGSIGGVIIASDAIQNGANNAASTFRLDSAGKARFGTATGNAIILDPAPSAGGLYIYHSSNGGTAASGKFSVSDGGLLTATGASISGSLTVGANDYWSTTTGFRLGGSTGINYSGSGNVTVGTGVTISGTFTAPTIQTQASVGTGTPNAVSGVIFNSDGIKGYSGTGLTPTFSLSSAGALTATGAVISGTLKAGTATNYTELSTNSYGQGSINFVYGTTEANIYYSEDGWLQTLVSSPGVGFSYINQKAISIELNAPTLYMYGRGEVNNTWGWGSYSTTASEQTEGTTILSNSIQIRRSNGQALWLHRYASSGTVELARFIYNGSDTGGINVNGSSAAFRTPSDYRLKENIEDYTESIDRIKSIRLRSFNLKSDPDKKQIIGFVAHELSEVDPELVMGEKDSLDSDGNPEYQSIMSGNLVPYLAGALKETILKIELLELRLDALEG
jgi:hypothetical protein